MMKRIRVVITGDVQGKFFRAAIEEKALMLDLTGYVRNQDDGSVEGVFEGEESDIDEMLDFCREGPRGASVDEVETTDEEYKGDFDGFEIRY